MKAWTVDKAWIVDNFWHVWLFFTFIGRCDPWGQGRMGPQFAWQIAGILAGKGWTKI